MHGTTKQKIKRKLFNIVKSNVPYRYNLKPKAIISPDKVAEKYKDNGAEYKLVLENHLTELPIDKGFFSKVASYTIYDEYEDTSPNEINIHYKTNYEVVKIPGGRIYSNNIDYISAMTSNNELVDRVSYQFNRDKRTTSEDNKILHQRYFTKPEYIDGTVFSMLAGYGATNNIAHWFFDSIPRIHLLKKSGLFDEIDYFLVPAFDIDYQKDSLNLLGIPDEKIIAGKEDTHIIAKNLVISSHPRGDRSFLLPLWISEFLRTSYLSDSVKDSSSPKRIFVSRKDSKLRQMINEDELVKILEKYGFETVLLSKYPLLEKIKLFHNAETIISSSGAGLTSLFFCKKNSNVVEIFPEGFVFTHYYNIAYHAGMNYYPMICKSDNPAQDMVAGQLEDIKVDLDEMQSILDKIFKQ